MSSQSIANLSTGLTESLKLRPRAYQWDVFDEARKCNVIAYLDTGSGKTLISVLLVKEKAAQNRENGLNKLIFFLAPKVDLVKQQADVLHEHTGLRVGDYVGEMGIESWQGSRWQKEFATHDVLVCTPMILLHILRRGYAKMSDLGLIIFDECHHTKKKDPYNRIMQEFYFDSTLQVADRPHIFGMTASPLDTKAVQNPVDVQRFFDDLESNLNAKIITVKDQEDVKKAAPLPTLREIWHPPSMPAVGSPVAVAQERLASIQTNLAGQGFVRKSEWQQSRPALTTADGRLLDAEPHSTETTILANTLGRVLHVLQEVGPYAALICFAEVLKPSVRSIYEQQSRESKRQEEEVAQLRKADANMTPDSNEMDAWWEGGEGLQTGAGQKVELSEHEDKSLCNILAKVYEIFRDLMDGLGHPGLTRIPGDLSDRCWADMRTQLRGHLEEFEKTIDRTKLASELLRPHSSHEGCSLVTPKAAALVQLLSEYKAACINARLKVGLPWSCIVFAQQKIVCLALARLLKACEGPLGFLRSSDLMGFGDRVAALSHSIQVQQNILKEFKKGDLNAIIATAVAEEGLDVMHCSLVVRFSLPQTARQFIQSRGRARAPGSIMALMLEEGAAAHQKLVEDALQFEKEMLVQAQSRASLPDPGEVEGCTSDEACSMPLSEREYRVASTGARVTLANAKALLFQFCQKLPSDRYAGALRPRFGTERQGHMFQTEVYLPSNSPVKQAPGLPQRKLSLAVSSACLVAVKLLHQTKALTDNLVPDPEVPEAEDDEFQLGPIGALRETAATRLCAIRPKWPEILKQAPTNASPSTFQIYRISLTEPGSDVPCSDYDLVQPLAFMVPRQLSGLPALEEISLDNGVKARLEFLHVGAHNLTEEQQQQIRTYHDFLIHRDPSVMSLLRKLPPSRQEARNRKQHRMAARQKFQVSSLQSGNSADLPNTVLENGEHCPLRFYDAALATAKAYQERHSTMPKDPSEEERERFKAQRAEMQKGESWLEKLAELNSTLGEESAGNAEANVHADTLSADAEMQEGSRSGLIEEGTGFPSAGALVVPLVKQSREWLVDWGALNFASNCLDSILDVPETRMKEQMVMTIYNQDAPQYYNVVRIRKDLQLGSEMPPQQDEAQTQNPQSPRRTFVEYYKPLLL